MLQIGRRYMAFKNNALLSICEAKKCTYSRKPGISHSIYPVILEISAVGYQLDRLLLFKISDIYKI